MTSSGCIVEVVAIAAILAHLTFCRAPAVFACIFEDWSSRESLDEASLNERHVINSKRSLKQLWQILQYIVRISVVFAQW